MDLSKHVRKVQAEDIDITLLGYSVVTKEDLSSIKAQSITLNGFYDGATTAEVVARILDRVRQVPKTTFYILRWPPRLFYGLAWCLDRLRLDGLCRRLCYRKYDVDPDRVTLEFTRDIEE